KSGKVRRVPLSADVLALLREQFSESAYVFPHAADPLKPVDARESSKQFARRLKQAGIASATWHTLRHTFASRQLRVGTDLVAVSRFLGHSTIQTTMRYAHHAKSALHQAVNRVSVTHFGTTTKPVETEEIRER
ncbi:MAG TPA: tyrosine-type recombinase/integrase, partial [Nitrospira sp.]|nr:tyrosine-type recombinase/integrase [Nitrospira sp.]